MCYNEIMLCKDLSNDVYDLLITMTNLHNFVNLVGVFENLESS